MKLTTFLKTIVFTFVLIQIFTNLYSQNQYYDALELRELTISESELILNEKVIKILKNYASETSEDKIILEFESNPFFKLIKESKDEIDTLESKESKEEFLYSTLTSVGSLNVTNFADGLAKFIVERTKQELSVAFFEKFKKDLDDIKQLQILFPTTYRILSVIDEEIYNFSAYIDLLREAFQKDLTLLLPDIKKLVDDECMDELFKIEPELRIILSDALFIINDLNEGNHFGDVLNNYVSNEVQKTELDTFSIYIYPAIQTLNLFSQSVRSKNPNNYWISQDSLNLLIKDPTTFNIYMGLIYQQAKKQEIKFDKTSLTFLLKTGKDTLDPYKNYIKDLVTKGKSVDYYFKQIKQKQDEGKDVPTYQDYYSLYDASLNLLEQISEIGSISSKLQTLLKPLNQKTINYFFTTSRSLGNIYVDIYEKQYSSAIIECSSIFQVLVDDRITDAIKSETDNCKKKQLEKYQEISSLVLKYGGFAAIVAKAENSDEVKKAIEAIALPAGSSRIKRETNFNVALNAYSGLYFGQERDKFWSVPKYSYGVTAPVGIAISRGYSIFFCGNRKKAWSSTLFMTFIDVGAITSFRFVEDSATFSDIQLKDIISPGIYYSLGLPKCPLSINLGYQINPLLKVMSSSGNTYQSGISRFSIGFCVDIPIVNFYTKPKK